MKLVNLTPHAIVVDRIGTIQPSGQIARVTMNQIDTGKTINDILVFKNQSGDVTGIPAPAQNTIYIVSAMVLSAISRQDVVAPDTGSTATRNDKGHIVSVIRFVGN